MSKKQAGAVSVKTGTSSPGPDGVVDDCVIGIDDLTIRFFPAGRGEVLATDAVSMRVRRGEILCIVGPSGCGKSTVLNATAGLLVGQPGPPVGVTGTITVDGRQTTNGDPRIGYMFQKDTLLPWKTAFENVCLPLALRKKKDRARTATELIARAGLSDFADRYPKELSGGMRKRIQLVQVLAQDPEIILMDEPFGALDAQTRALMQQEFLQVWERDRKTIVFVTHDLNEAILLGDRILCMTARPGRIKAEFDVPLPRPRTLEALTGDPHYSSLFNQLWAAVREEADKSMSQTVGVADS